MRGQILFAPDELVCLVEEGWLTPGMRLTWAAERGGNATFMANPPGLTPGYGNHSTNSNLASVSATTKGFTVSSPALFGHKLDGQCGQSGP